MPGKYTDGSNYGYTPSIGWTGTYVALFAAVAIIHTALAIRSKYWVIFPTLVLGALIECLGWSGRTWSSLNVHYLTPFLMQICTLIMAPVFFSAYDYTVLGLAISKLGPQYSILKPSQYFAVFITADIVSLILQAVGGGQASASAGKGVPTTSATNIMVAGIIFQLVSMVIFVAFGADFVIRATMKRPYAYQERRLVRKTEASRVKAAAEANNDTEKHTDRAALEHRASSVSASSYETRVQPATSNANANASKINNFDAEALQCHGEGGMNERQLMRRWWMLLVGVAFSSLMIVIRGVFRSIELSQGWKSEAATTENYQNLLDGLPMILAVAIFIPFHPLFLLPARKSWKGVH